MYGYRVMPDQEDDLIEEGTCFPLSSMTAASLIISMRSAQLFPLVLLLRRSRGGNHFQAVTYVSQKYDAFSQDLNDLIEKRNNILMAHGFDALNGDLDDIKQLPAQARRIQAQATNNAKRSDTTRVKNVFDLSDDFEDAPRPLRRTPAAIIAHSEAECLKLFSGEIPTERSSPDYKLLRAMKGPNSKAFGQWYASKANEAQAYRRHAKGKLLDEFMSANGTHPVAARSVTAVLPFPEMALRDTSKNEILRWGQWEVTAVQISQLKSAMQNDRITSVTRSGIQAWVNACDNAEGQAACTFTGATDRWEDLQRRAPAIMNRSKPQHLSSEHWQILHLLPYVYKRWNESQLAQRSTL